MANEKHTVWVIARSWREANAEVKHPVNRMNKSMAERFLAMCEERIEDFRVHKRKIYRRLVNG